MMQRMAKFNFFLFFERPGNPALTNDDECFLSKTDWWTNAKTIFFLPLQMLKRNLTFSSLWSALNATKNWTFKNVNEFKFLWLNFSSFLRPLHVNTFFENSLKDILNSSILIYQIPTLFHVLQVFISGHN